MTQNKKNFLIAITGGIGSGKSTALSAVKNAGGQVISCDEITRALYNKHDLKFLQSIEFNNIGNFFKQNSI